LPYSIVKASDGKFKVCKLNNPSVCFSKVGIPLNRAKSQLKAIGINESKSKSKTKSKTK